MNGQDMAIDPHEDQHDHAEIEIGSPQTLLIILQQPHRETTGTPL